jgi:hypothetical protein
VAVIHCHGEILAIGRTLFVLVLRFNEFLRHNLIKSKKVKK